jgi:hypothetical protein
MSFWLALLVLFTLGVLHDILWTLYIRAVSMDLRIRASLVSGLLTAFGFVAWSIMVKTGFEATAIGIVAYSVGGTLGTYISFNRRKT